MNYRLGIHVDPFSHSGLAFGFDGDATSARAGGDKIDAALRLVEMTKADLVYLDVAKAFIPPMARGHMTAGGFWALVAAGVPAARGLLDRLEKLTERVSVLWYMGFAPGAGMPSGLVEGIYRDLKDRGVKFIAQDYSGTAKDGQIDLLHEWDLIIPTLVEGPADDGPDGDDLLDLGCVLPASSWFRSPRAQQHKGLRVALHNVGPFMDRIDEDYAGKPLWTMTLPHWCGDCRARGFVPVVAPYGQPSGYDWALLRGTDAVPAPAEKA